MKIHIRTSAFIVCASLLARGAFTAEPGDVLVGGSADSPLFNSIGVFSPTGVLESSLRVNIWPDQPFSEVSAMAFDAAGNLYAVNYQANTIARFSGTSGSPLEPNPFVTNDAGSHGGPIVFDESGNFFVGQIDGAGNILKRDSTGALLDRYYVNNGARGSIGMDLAADQKTIFYTSGDDTIRRYDISRHYQLPDFGTLPGGQAYAVRLLGDGGLLVAVLDDVKRFDSTGTIVQSYGDPLVSNALVSLALDPNGTSFWTGDYFAGIVYEFNIATGAIEQQWTTGGGVSGLAVVGPSLTSGPPRGEPGGPIILGGIFNLKGAQAVLDVPSAMGAQLAVDQVNNRGGLLGRPVKLVIEDGQSRPKKLHKNTVKILKKYPSVAGFLGLSDTDMVLAAAPPAVDTGHVFLTSGATSPLLPSQVPPSLYLACFGDNVQAAAAAEYAYNTLGATSASILYDSTDTYTVLLQDYFRTRFEQLGGTILDIRGFQGEDLAGPISQLSTADVIFFSAAPSAAFDGVDQLRHAGFTAPILGGDGFDSEDAWAARPSVRDVFFTTHVYLGADNPDRHVIQFRLAYQAAYPGADLNSFAALGYDAANLLMEAIREARSADPNDVLLKFPNLAVQGATGEIRYVGGSRVPLKSVSIIAVNDGRLSLADQFIPASVPAP